MVINWSFYYLLPLQSIPLSSQWYAIKIKIKSEEIRKLWEEEYIYDVSEGSIEKE